MKKKSVTLALSIEHDLPDEALDAAIADAYHAALRALLGFSDADGHYVRTASPAGT
jgi:hypothetical protein